MVKYAQDRKSKQGPFLCVLEAIRFRLVLDHSAQGTTWTTWTTWTMGRLYYIIGEGFGPSILSPIRYPIHGLPLLSAIGLKSRFLPSKFILSNQRIAFACFHTLITEHSPQDRVAFPLLWCFCSHSEKTMDKSTMDK